MPSAEAPFPEVLEALVAAGRTWGFLPSRRLMKPKGSSAHFVPCTDPCTGTTWAPPVVFGCGVLDGLAGHHVRQRSSSPKTCPARGTRNCGRRCPSLKRSLTGWAAASEGASRGFSRGKTATTRYTISDQQKGGQQQVEMLLLPGRAARRSRRGRPVTLSGLKCAPWRFPQIFTLKADTAVRCIRFERLIATFCLYSGAPSRLSAYIWTLYREQYKQLQVGCTASILPSIISTYSTARCSMPSGQLRCPLSN